MSPASGKMMEITTSKFDRFSVVNPFGKIDAFNAPQLEESLNDLLNRGEKNVIIDFSGVSYISSAGLRVLLVTAKRLHSDGQFALCQLKREVLEIIEMVGFTKIINLYDDLESAKAALSR
jgi:anti-sigma B factor antagonist